MLYVKNENTVRLYKIPLLFLFHSADSWHFPARLYAGAKDGEELTATEAVRAGDGFRNTQWLGPDRKHGRSGVCSDSLGYTVSPRKT